MYSPAAVGVLTDDICCRKWISENILSSSLLDLVSSSVKFSLRQVKVLCDEEDQVMGKDFLKEHKGKKLENLGLILNII